MSRALAVLGLVLGLAAVPAHPAQAPGVVTITPDNFKAEVLGSSLPVLVDVGATWCVPCRLLNPLVDKMAVEYAGRLKVVRVDADANGDLVDNLGIQAFPTLLFFKKGKVVKTAVGLETEKELRSQIDRVLGPASAAKKAPSGPGQMH
ncbi:MAG TPA: thioredoxin domain-containing protein [bacterium]|nr:thioredoxin domain-containing protein [bacterium]